RVIHVDDFRAELVGGRPPEVDAVGRRERLRVTAHDPDVLVAADDPAAVDEVGVGEGVFVHRGVGPQPGELPVGRPVDVHRRGEDVDGGGGGGHQTWASRRA